MTAGTPPAPTALARRWATGWGHVVFLILSLLSGCVAITLVTLVITGVALIPIALMGLLLLIPSLWVAEEMGRWERLRVRAFTGVRIDPPEGEAHSGWRRLVLSPRRWRATAFWALHSMWGLLCGAAILLLTAQSLLLLALPLIDRLLPQAGIFNPGVRIWWLLRADSTPTLVALWIGSAVVLVCLPWLARLLTAVDIHLARWLIGADPQARLQTLTDRVDTLTQTRQESVDSVEAERRRIERDLHDGPQQRLVSIAMGLGMAREALARDPQAAAELLDAAHASSKEAIVEMRQVARGITPPILTDRGLDAALSALATRCPVPVRLSVAQIGRLDPTLEAIAYFCVSEALTNVAKHAQAGSAAVEVSTAASLVGTRDLVVAVSDDGIGGAHPSGGLTGLRQRLAAVDGHLDLRSPPGGGTTLTFTLPLRSTRSTS